MRTYRRPALVRIRDIDGAKRRVQVVQYTRRVVRNLQVISRKFSSACSNGRRGILHAVVFERKWCSRRSGRWVVSQSADSSEREFRVVGVQRGIERCFRWRTTRWAFPIAEQPSEPVADDA